jgi:hypothetical protein
MIMMALVAAYIGVVVLAHVLLVTAIYRCLREDHVGGRRRTIDAGSTPMPGNVNVPLPAR